MSDQMVDVTLHIDENTTHTDREQLRDKMLQKDGVAAALFHVDKPHLMIVEYDPQEIKASELAKAVQESGYHAELIGL